jgi:hypothetical protein
MKHDMRVSKSFKTADGLDAVRMSENQRRMAKATLRQAEKFAHFLFWLDAQVRHGIRLAERSVGALFRHGKPAGARPALH